MSDRDERIAETGSVMLLSGPEHPTTLNFLPEDHIVVLRESWVVPHLEDARALLRKERDSDTAHRQPHLRPLEDRRRRTRDPRRRARAAAAARRRGVGMTGSPLS